MIQECLKIGPSIETREVALLVQISSKFSSEIKIKLDDKTVNAKSIMGIIALGALAEKDITLQADGDDEKEAMTELTEFLS